jgi:hypothetical protein
MKGLEWTKDISILYEGLQFRITTNRITKANVYTIENLGSVIFNVTWKDIMGIKHKKMMCTRTLAENNIMNGKWEIV